MGHEDGLQMGLTEHYDALWEEELESTPVDAEDARDKWEDLITSVSLQSGAAFNKFSRMVRAAKRREAWITKDGKEIKIGHMGSSHLQNTVNWLGRTRGYPCRLGYIELMTVELHKRKKAAVDGFARKGWNRAED